ncbi:mevalonate kinase [Marinilactibacillus psychrotolerans]|uniref:Mevalonate kinase n=1 Tax=Marinilactibacillus psychrotolerans TaxID=191770 RepID=A0AAV3W807_9LACT|nr:mevalonate kinase [Marinilactibacillus psychrotolerans]GEL66604.1 mevalonate kinase [Marinilactibacillus psychrotolerans]GEQ35126.1 mevalonate kinase [Marinilactibacillus psychrotolerans]SDC82544.1 mevalonate kinase [Marinilactibacillus psychrotolerans]
MKTLSDQAIGTAHGKIILIGEHSVVYNEPAIALPFPAANVEVRIKAIEGESKIFSSYYNGPLASTPASLYNLKHTIEMICEDLNADLSGMLITISSLIPPERGMGSSAAVATALIRAIYTFFDYSLDNETLLYYIGVSEKIAHGNPSGLDARITSGTQPVYFIKSQTPQTFDIEVTGYLIAADTGLTGQTREAVHDVAQLLKKSKRKTKLLISSLGSLTVQAKKAIEEDDINELGMILSKAHRHLSDLSVSNEKLDLLVQTALKSGALGAKLTGSGRGGCMIALAKSFDQAKHIASELINNGAVETWIHSLGVNTHE